MKTFLIATIAIVMLAMSTSIVVAQTEATPVSAASQILAKQELNQAASSYREGNFAEAQQHSERALALDPNNRAAPMFIARTIHAQFKPGDSTPENLAKGREAIEAYKRLLIRTPKDEESYKAIAYLYGAIGEEQSQRDWILRRAADTAVEPEKRAEAYIVLASKDWDCSFKITELPTTKRTSVVNKQAVVRYLMPKDGADFEQARQCAERGLQMTDLAIVLAPQSQSAWSYRTNILLELGKLAEMEGNFAQREVRMGEYEVALKETKRLAEKSPEKKQP